jgi:hypothetical protein
MPPLGIYEHGFNTNSKKKLEKTEEIQSDH